VFIWLEGDCVADSHNSNTPTIDGHVTNVTDTPPPKEAKSSKVNLMEQPPEPRLTVVEPRHNWNLADVREIWLFRELLFFLTLRDIKLRYKQTILGIGWSLFQPLATVLVFVVFIGYMGKASEGVPNYLLFVLCGVLPWTYFANATTNAANSLVGNERLVTKIFFPRVLLPASNVGAATFDFLLALLILTVWMIVDGPAPTWRLIFTPMLMLLIGMTAFGFGSMLSALIAVQRDFRYLLNFGMQLWMFATPCIYYSADKLGPTAQKFLPMNPIYGLILNFRNSVMGEPMDWFSLSVSVAFSVFILGFGLIYFRRVENTMADTI
jgi:lipopolysaccharide transport system permease protein